MTDDTPAKSSRKDSLLRVRVEAAELDAIKSRAAASGLTLSDYVRQICLSGKVSTPRARADQDALRLLLAAGRNVNQIAKSGHVHRRIDVVALSETLAEIRAAVSRFLP